MIETTDVTRPEPMPMEPTGPCWVCGGTRHEPVWTSPFDLSDFPRFGPYAHANHPDTRIVRCLSCGFGQPEALPGSPDYFDTLYHIDWSPESLDREFEIGYKDIIFQTIIDELGRRLRPGVPRTLLDVGTHVGKFPYMAAQSGWEAEGIELNPLTAAYAAERTGLPIHSVKAEELAASGRKYGAVTFTDVLEHIPRPAPLVAALRGLLHPGGILAIKVPHAPMQVIKERVRQALHRDNVGIAIRFVHVNHFSVASLRTCLEQAGFRDVDVTIGAPECIPPVPWRTRGQALTAKVRRGVYALGRALPGGVHTPLSLHLQAYAVAAD